MRAAVVLLSALVAGVCVLHTAAPVSAATQTVQLTGGVLWPTVPNFWMDLSATISNGNITGTIQYDDSGLVSNDAIALGARTDDSPPENPNDPWTGVARPGFSITLNLSVGGKHPELEGMSILQDTSRSMAFPMLQFYKRKFIGM